jgi:hypothetical protein
MLRLTDFIIDCPDTMKLAAFYSEVTGRPVKAGSHENWAGIQFGEIELAIKKKHVPETSLSTDQDAPSRATKATDFDTPTRRSWTM